MSYEKKANTTEEAIQAALEAIKSTGTYSAGASVLNVSTATFFAWREKDKELRERCDHAKSEHWKTSDVTLRVLARDAAYRTLKNGVETTTETSKEEMTPEGEIITLTSVSHRKSGPPMQLVLRYLGSDLEEVSLLRAMVAGGYLPQSSLEEFDNALAVFRSTITGIVAGENEAEGIPEISQAQLISAASSAIEKLFTNEAPTLSAEVVEG